MEYLIKQYPVETGALEIQYIEEFFGEFPRRKTAAEVMDRLSGRESLVLMAEAPLPDDPGTLVPVSYKVVHEVGAHENIPKLRDLVERLEGHHSIRRPPGSVFLDRRDSPRLARARSLSRAHRRDRRRGPSPEASTKSW